MLADPPARRWCSHGRFRQSLWLTGGNINHTTELEAVLTGIRVLRSVGRPRTTPDRVIADKGYSSRGALSVAAIMLGLRR